MPECLLVFHDAAAELNDRDLVTELPNPAHRLDEQIGLLNGVLYHGMLDTRREGQTRNPQGSRAQQNADRIGQGWHCRSGRIDGQ